MKKIFRFFRFNSYSFSTKVIFSFFVFIVFFMLIRTILTVPKIEKNALNDEIEYITRSLLLTKEQIKIIGKSLRMQSELEIKLSKKTVENEILKIDKEKEIYKIEEALLKSKILKYCSFKITGENFDFKSTKNGDYFHKNNIKILNKWEIYKIESKDKAFRKKDYFFYNYKMSNANLLLEIGCNYGFLNPNHMNFEKNLKEHIHPNLLINSSLNSTKTAVFWLNPNILENKDVVLYEKNSKNKQKKYTISMLSNVDNIPTGNLTIKEILNIKDQNKPITHKIDKKEVLTWIIDLNSDTSSNRYILLAYTIDKVQLEKKNKTKVLSLLPETLIAIGISFILILLLFKRILKNLNTITKTAIQVKQGKKNIRSNVKGEDDIGILGESFDSMLDFFENSIKTLDKKVEEKTKEISQSLEEKEILLKEIHHRVKNNLALTISFIELQEDEIKDEKVKKVLIDIQDRIYTMELLHRKLYESTNLNKIPFKNYITDLIDTISKTHDIEKKVSVEILMEELELNIEAAMPCGLILNELITNAFKYAFKDLDKPKLSVIFTNKNNQLKIIVKDNGKGLFKQYEQMWTNSLGLKLVNTIVKHQLFGTIVYEYDKGAKFVISGKLNNKK